MEQNSLENRKRSWLSEMSSSAGRSSRQTNKDTRASIFVVAMIISLKRSPFHGLPMPRRMIQRAFLKWLEENRSRFAIEIKLGRRTDNVLEFTFAGINRAISGALTTWEINVTVMLWGSAGIFC